MALSSIDDELSFGAAQRSQTNCQIGSTSYSRCFAYDFLSRLTSPNNPETGTVQYSSYDGNGNLVTKTDARGITTYDVLDRVATKTYSDSTPAVTYTYDTAATGCFDKGRLSKVQSTASTTNLLCYDALGRVTSSSQVTNSQTYTFPAYTWNLVGSLASIAYPSGRVVTTSYDKANRPYQVAGTLSSNSTTYASCPSAVSPTDPCYASHGALTQLLFGNQQTEQTCYNNRLQPFLMRFGPGAVSCSNPPTTPAAADLLNLALGYGGANNNGNLQSQLITRQGTSWSQSYGYDKLNRLLTAVEGSNWNQTNAYDAFGNRWVTNPTPPTVETPTASTWYTTGSSPTGCPPWQPNRISGWCYDAAGNITSVTGMQRTFAYDAENRQTTATINGTATTYAYDGDGRRVQKVSGGVTTAFVYDAQGQLTAEYGPATDSGTTYLTIDHLGSTTVVDQ